MLMQIEDVENGFVGIGTTGMPVSALQVRGQTNGITASVEGTDINNYLLKLQSNTAGTVQDVLYASARGEIAIGHTQPENKLHIHGSL
jgi:hypothetical protein